MKLVIKTDEERSFDGSLMYRTGYLVLLDDKNETLSRIDLEDLYEAMRWTIEDET